MEPLGPVALRNLQDKCKLLRVLVIDEKSFLGLFYMYQIDCRLREIFANNRPFGGISVVLMGDFAQLTPVGDKALYLPNGGNLLSAQQLAGYSAYRDNFLSVLCLETSMRQDGDENFRKLLEQMQKGALDDDQLKLLMARHVDRLPNAADFDQALLLTAYKADYLPHTREQIQKLETPKVMIRSVNTPAQAARASADAAGGLPKHTVLARKMPVMLIQNIDLSCGLTNGARGEIVAIVHRETGLAAQEELPEVLVKFDGYTGLSCLPDEPKVFCVGPLKRTWHNSRGKTLSRTMLPLVPAYGMTIHKSQGQTLQKAKINLGTEFAGGLTYTGLSRVKRLSDLAFVGVLTRERLNFFSTTAAFTHVKNDIVRKAQMFERTQAAALGVQQQAGAQAGQPPDGVAEE